MFESEERTLTMFVLPQKEEESERSLLDEILDETERHVSPEWADDARTGMQYVLKQILGPDLKGTALDRFTVDLLIADIDRRIAKQIDEILHHPRFQSLESAWRTLRYMVDQFDFRENVRLEILSVSKEELLEDFEDSPEVVRSGLYHHIYTKEFGVYGGHPYAMVSCQYEFGPGIQDLDLLRNVAAVSAMAHTIFIGNASQEFFGIENLSELSDVPNISSIFDTPQFAKWRAFRSTEDARYVGLCLPRFLVRQPYRQSMLQPRAIEYEERAKSHEDYLWGPASAALATRVADSFARYRWAPNIIGPDAGGTVQGLTVSDYDALRGIQPKIVTEVALSNQRELELAELGFIGMVARRVDDTACFFSANSVQVPKHYSVTEGGQNASTNYRLATQLPYMFIICRLAHYLKVIQRQNLGLDLTRSDMERELNLWLRQYVSDMEDPRPEIRQERPLRSAKATVHSVVGETGWFLCNLYIRPHFKYMGANFTLSLVGKLDLE